MNRPADSHGAMHPVVVRARAFTQIEDSSTSAAIPAIVSPPASPPRGAKTVEIRRLVSPTRSSATTSRASTTVSAAVTSPVAAALTASASVTPSPKQRSMGRALYNSVSPPHKQDSPKRQSPATRTADDLSIEMTQRVSEWKDEAARLSMRVQELEVENRQLRSSSGGSGGTRKRSVTIPPKTSSGGEQLDSTAPSSLSDQENYDGSNARKAAVKTRMRKSMSVASGFGGAAGLTVAEAVAASHRSRSKRQMSAKEPLQKYKSGYWNEQANVKSSFSCNNLADMEQRALFVEKPRPASGLHKSLSANTRSNAKANRDGTALLKSTSRKSDTFVRKSSEPDGEDLAAHHKQQLAMARSFHGSTRVPTSQRQEPVEYAMGELIDGEEDGGNGEAVHVTSPRSYIEANLRGIGGSFRLPNRSKSLALAKRPSSTDVRIWVGSWNMGAADPFVDKSGIIDEQASAAMLQSFIPHGYHVYVLGLQEGVSENAYHAVTAYLNRNEQGTRYFRMELKNGDSMVVNKSHPSEATIDAVRGRGDGAFVGTKFTGLAVFHSESVKDKVKLLRAGIHKFNITSGSKGGVAAGLMVNHTSMVFVNCHLDARNDSYRREQIRNLNANLGKAMGHPNFDLTEQFHHVVWMGDMNYRIVHLDPDIVLHMLEEGRNGELHDKFDGLLNDRRNGGVFDGFTEPNKFPDFYPTYKKFPKRGRVNYRSPSWTRLVYRVLYKEPFYKGGKVKKRVPGWCDRILIHSLLVSDSKLMPEKVLSPFEDQMTWIDNYRSVNEGDGMDVSDHSPVYATFTLSFPQTTESQSALSPRLIRRNSRSLSSVSTREPSSQRSTVGGSYFDNPSVVRRIAANVPSRPVSTVLRVFNMQLYWNDNVVVPKRTRVVAPLIGEDAKQCDVLGERCQGLNGLNLSLNAVVQHTRPLEHLHMLVWVKNESISGHCTLSLKRVARQDEGNEVKFRVPLYSNSMRLYYDGHPLVLVFSVRSKTFAK